jgi:hypothetical protein
VRLGANLACADAYYVASETELKLSKTILEINDLRDLDRPSIFALGRGIVASKRNGDGWPPKQDYSWISIANDCPLTINPYFKEQGA